MLSGTDVGVLVTDYTITDKCQMGELGEDFDVNNIR